VTLIQIWVLWSRRTVTKAHGKTLAKKRFRCILWALIRRQRRNVGDLLGEM
jgi:hypothetical protein